MKASIHGTTCMLLAGLLSTAVAQDKVGREDAEAVVGPPLDRPVQTRLTELPDMAITDEAAKSMLKNMEAAKTLEKAATSIESVEAAAKYLNRASMEALDGTVDFSKDKLLLFVWQGSSSDHFYGSPLVSRPPEAAFSYEPGQEKDLKTHVKIFALQKDAKWSVSTSQRIRIDCGNGVNGQVELNLEGAVGVQGKIDLRVNGQPVPVPVPAQPQAPGK